MKSRGSKLALAGLIATTVVGALDGLASNAYADDLSKGVPSREALQRKTALKLAGLATFVATSCSDLKLDPDRFKAAITALGVTTKDLDDPKTKFAYLEYTMAYKEDVPANCARARAEFGPQGKTLPRLFQVADVPAKAPAAGSSPPSGKAPSAAPPSDKKP